MPHSGRITKVNYVLLTDLCAIFNKQAEVKFIVDRRAPHILAITESRLQTNFEDAEIMLPGFNLFHQDRQNNKKGGCVLISSHKSLLAERIISLTTPTSDGHELTEYKWSICGNRYVLVVFYRSLDVLSKMIFSSTTL